MKTALKNLLLFILAFLLAGCTAFTKKLWKDTDPNHVVWIDADQISEEALRAKGVEYKRYFSEKHNGYTIRKSDKDKFKDYTYRALGTPVTLAADAAATTACGAVVFGFFFITSDAGVDWLNDLCN
jgi:hypothetical protein